jgi:hypothetical protein
MASLHFNHGADASEPTEHRADQIFRLLTSWLVC